MNFKQNTIIESMGVYLPPLTVSTDEIVKGCKNKIHFNLEKVTGIKTRRMAGENEFSIDLAKKAISDCLSRSKYDSTDIDLLICCNISRYDAPGSISFEPSTAVKLKKDLSFTNALSFDISNACAGMFTAIYIVNAFIQAGQIRRGMVVSGEYITHLSLAAQKEIEGFMDTRLACLTLGDAGAALILEKATEQHTGFQELHMQSFGSYSEYCVAKPSGTGEFVMYTDSMKLTDTAVRSGARHAMNLLEEGGWKPESFHHLIMHQTSSMTLNSARREINRLLETDVCHDGNTVNNLEHRGNTASTAHFIAVADQIQNNKINAGDKVVFSISASGLTIGTGLYVFDDLPVRMRETHTTTPIPENEKVAGRKRFVSGRTGKRIRVESAGTIPVGFFGKMNSMDALVQSATECLERSAYQCNDIGLLIYSGVYRSGYILEPAYATMLAGRLNMNATSPATDNRRTLAFDIFNGAVGFLDACYVAQQMITAGEYATAMIMAAETDNNATSSHESVGYAETASAFILDAPSLNEEGFSRFHFKYDLESIDAYATHYKVEDVGSYLHIKKESNLEELYLGCIATAVKELLQLEELEPCSIDIIFPPQISHEFITRLSEKLDLSRERFVDAVGDGTDLFSSSLPYAFRLAREKQLVKPGNTGLIINVGSGIQVGCAIYHF